MKVSNISLNIELKFLLHIEQSFTFVLLQIICLLNGNYGDLVVIFYRTNYSYSRFLHKPELIIYITRMRPEFII